MAKDIEVLLTETIENLGIVGDVVKVRAGYARNYLLPYLYATIPTPEKIEELAARRAEVAAELAKQRESLEAIFSKLDEYTLVIERAANDIGHLFGGVSQQDIAEALREAGIAVENRHVRVGEKINRTDTYYIPIQLAKDLKTEITLIVKSNQPVEEEAPAEEAAEEATDAE